MATDHAEVLLRKSQDPPLGGSVRDCRSSGLKDEKLGPFTLFVLMIGAVFQKLPRISRKIHGSAVGCSFHHAPLLSFEDINGNIGLRVAPSMGPLRGSKHGTTAWPQTWDHCVAPNMGPENTPSMGWGHCEFGASLVRV